MEMRMPVLELKCASIDYIDTGEGVVLLFLYANPSDQRDFDARRIQT